MKIISQDGNIVEDCKYPDLKAQIRPNNFIIVEICNKSGFVLAKYKIKSHALRALRDVLSAYHQGTCVFRFPDEEFYKTPYCNDIETLDMSKTVKWVLRREGINTIDDLINSSDMLRGIRLIGEKREIEIKTAIEKACGLVM